MRAAGSTGSGVADAGKCATEAHKTQAPPDAVRNHRCGIGTRTNLAKKRDQAARLLHHAEQRTPGLVLRLLGGGLRLAGSAPQHFVAQRLEVGTVNSFELHPDVEDDDREQLSRLSAIALVENLAALLERLEHRLQLFV